MKDDKDFIKAKIDAYKMLITIFVVPLFALIAYIYKTNDTNLFVLIAVMVCLGVSLISGCFMFSYISMLRS